MQVSTAETESMVELRTSWGRVHDDVESHSAEPSQYAERHLERKETTLDALDTLVSTSLSSRYFFTSFDRRDSRKSRVMLE